MKREDYDDDAAVSGDKEQAFSGCLGILQNVKRPAIKACPVRRQDAPLFLLSLAKRDAFHVFR